MMKKIAVVALALTMLLTCLPAFAVAASESPALIANGSFDGGSAEGWVYGLRAGASATAATPATSTMETTNTESYDADGYSFHVVSKDNPETVDAVENENLMLFYHLTDEELVKGNTYYVSLYVKTAVDSKVALKVRSGKMVNGGETYLTLHDVSKSGAISSNEGWKQFAGAFRYVEEEGQPGVSIIVDVLNAGDVDFYVDNVEVKCLNEDSNLICNASFDGELFGWRYGLVDTYTSQGGINTDSHADKFTVGTNGDQTNAAHIQHDGSARIGIKQYIPLTAADSGELFSVSFKANLVSGNVTRMGFRGGDKMNGNNNATVRFESDINAAAGQGWKEYSQIFAYTHDDTEIGVSFLIDMSAQAELWIDDVVLEKLEIYEEGNMVANPSFDADLYSWKYGEPVSGIANNDATGFVIADSTEKVGTVGENALHFTKADSVVRKVLYNYIPLTADDNGKTFQVTAYANLVSGELTRFGIRSGNKVNGGTNQFNFYSTDTLSNVMGTNVAIKRAFGGWKRHSMLFTYTHNEAEPGVSFVVDFPAFKAVDFWLDEVKVREVNTLLRNDGTFEAYTEYARAGKDEVTSLQWFTYGSDVDVFGKSNASPLKADHKLVASEDGGYYLKIDDSTSGYETMLPFAFRLEGANWNNVSVGDVVKFSIKLRVNSALGTDYEGLTLRYGSKYHAMYGFAEGIETAAVTIPAASQNKWIDLEFYFLKRDVTDQMVMICPGTIVEGLSIDIDNAWAEPVTEAEMKEVNVFGKAKMAGITSAEPAAFTPCAVLVNDSTAPVYAEGKSTYAFIFDAGLENKIASYALYKNDGTTTKMVGLSIPEEASPLNVLKLTVPETLDDEATYTVKALLWGGTNFFTPVDSIAAEIAQ